MMTSETRTLIELGDIMGVEFACDHCKATLLCPLNEHLKVEQLPPACPNCRKEWFPYDGKNVSALHLVKEFIVGLEALIARKEVKAQISWQVRLPSGAKGD